MRLINFRIPTVLLGIALLVGTGTFAKPTFAQVYAPSGPTYAPQRECRKVKVRDSTIA